MQATVTLLSGKLESHDDGSSCLAFKRSSRFGLTIDLMKCKNLFFAGYREMSTSQHELRGREEMANVSAFLCVCFERKINAYILTVVFCIAGNSSVFPKGNCSYESQLVTSLGMNICMLGRRLPLCHDAGELHNRTASHA